MKNSLLLAIAALFPIFAQAGTYHTFTQNSQLHMRSKEGLNIILLAEDYESGYVADSQTNTAEQIRIVVNGPNLNFSTQGIRAVLTSNCVSVESGAKVNQPTLMADLTPSTDGSSLDFSAGFSGALVTRSAVHGGDYQNCQPQLSIVVDGTWQTDPVNGSHNFNLENF